MNTKFDSTCTHSSFEIDSHGDFHFTKAGKARYLPLLQRIGVDINSITTLERFRLARRIILTMQMEELEKEMTNTHSSLDQRWLLAFVLGNESESERLGRLIKRRHKKGLKVIK